MRIINVGIQETVQDIIFQQHSALSHSLMGGDVEGQDVAIIALIIYYCLDAHMLFPFKNETLS